jgi:hypothetical protein
VTDFSIGSINCNLNNADRGSISNLIKILVNKSIESSIFPENIKAAQVSPLFRKNNSLDKGNYKPVSVESVLISHMIPILTKVNYAVTVKSF